MIIENTTESIKLANILSIDDAIDDKSFNQKSINVQISLGSVSIDNRSIDMSPKLKSPDQPPSKEQINPKVSPSPDSKEKTVKEEFLSKQFLLNQKGIHIQKKPIAPIGLIHQTIQGQKKDKIGK